MKRSKNEIIAEILQVCLKGANKTKIVYQTNLNFKSVNRYLDLLIKNGHLSADVIKNKDGRPDVVLYTTTEKGEVLINLLSKLDSFIS